MNCTELGAFKDRFPIPMALPNLIYGRGIIRSEYILKIFIKLPSEPIVGTMNIWLCHLGFGMHLLRFRQLWMKSLDHTYRSFCWYFFDDILVYSRTWEEHLNHLKVVLKILSKHKFFVKPSKCVFGAREVEYLGHIISHEVVRVDNRKIEAMQCWPKPKTVMELRGFLGLTGYYNKFVRNYGPIAGPLTDLLKKGNFVWNPKVEEAFEELKRAMVSTPDFSGTFVVETDASDYGIGAILGQKGRPIEFLSKSLGPTKKNWSIYTKEMLAILEAIKTWWPYLLWQKFQIQTNQRSLKYLLERHVVTPEQQKWVSKLVGYEYEIIYRPRKTNAAADSFLAVGTVQCYIH